AVSLGGVATGVQFDADQRDGVDAEADRALGKAGVVVEQETLAPLVGFTVVIGGVVGVEVVVEIAQAQRGFTVFNETGSQGLLGQQADSGNSECQGCFCHGDAPGG